MARRQWQLYQCAVMAVSPLLLLFTWITTLPLPPLLLLLPVPPPSRWVVTSPPPGGNTVPSGSLFPRCFGSSCLATGVLFICIEEKCSSHSFERWTLFQMRVMVRGLTIGVWVWWLAGVCGGFGSVVCVCVVVALWRNPTSCSTPITVCLFARA